jgi:hypothetical protein
LTENISRNHHRILFNELNNFTSFLFNPLNTALMISLSLGRTTLKINAGVPATDTPQVDWKKPAILVTPLVHRHRHPTAEVRHVQDQQPEQITAGNDGTGNGEIPNPRMVAKEIFHNIPLSNKTSLGSLTSETGAVHFDDSLDRLIQRQKSSNRLTDKNEGALRSRVKRRISKERLGQAAV